MARVLRHRKAVTYNQRVLEMEIGSISDEDWDQPSKRTKPACASAIVTTESDLDECSDQVDR